MAEVVAVYPVEVRPVVQAVHLVHAHVAQLLAVRVDGVHHRPRLAVGEGDDDVGAGVDEGEDGLG